MINGPVPACYLGVPSARRPTNCRSLLLSFRRKAFSTSEHAVYSIQEKFGDGFVYINSHLAKLYEQDEVDDYDDDTFRE
ncbi:hypothetical protein [Micromonospora sp. NPDC007230]|uniref:hypothetical protein n=1 Tax=Micromonospora sp. NPDC007230 TaxID=3364237 RepID=UPI0036A61377